MFFKKYRVVFLALFLLFLFTNHSLALDEKEASFKDLIAQEERLEKIKNNIYSLFWGVEIKTARQSEALENAVNKIMSKIEFIEEKIEKRKRKIVEEMKSNFFEGESDKDIINNAFLGKKDPVKCFYFKPTVVNEKPSPDVKLYVKEGWIVTVTLEREEKIVSILKEDTIFRWDGDKKEGYKIALGEGWGWEMVDHLQERHIDCVGFANKDIFKIPEDVDFMALDPTETVVQSVVSISCDLDIGIKGTDFPSSLSISPADTYYDVDLRVYDGNGNHVGQNYDKGRYELEIDGAAASGNLGSGGPEWISVLGSIKNYDVFIDPFQAHRWAEKNGLDIEIHCDVRLMFDMWDGERIEPKPINIDINLKKPNLIDFSQVEL
jgi:hypothetical protein